MNVQCSYLILYTQTNKVAVVHTQYGRVDFSTRTVRCTDSETELHFDSQIHSVQVACRQSSRLCGVSGHVADATITPFGDIPRFEVVRATSTNLRLSCSITSRFAEQLDFVFSLDTRELKVWFEITRGGQVQKVECVEHACYGKIFAWVSSTSENFPQRNFQLHQVDVYERRVEFYLHSMCESAIDDIVLINYQIFAELR